MVFKNVAGVLTLVILVSGCVKDISSKYSSDKFIATSRVSLTKPHQHDSYQQTQESLAQNKKFIKKFTANKKQKDN